MNRSGNCDFLLTLAYTLSLTSLSLFPAPARAAVKELFPGQSFETAVESLQQGDTLIVHAGTYSNTGRISMGVKGTAAQPVTVKGAPGEARPLITRPSNSTPQNTVNIEGASYLTLRGLEITGNGDGIRLSGIPHHITIEDIIIHDIHVGINLRSSMDHITVRGNHIYNTSDTAEGMYIGCHAGDCAVSDSIIENNWIHNTRGSQGDGIEIKYGSWGNIIRHNVIHDAQSPCILAYGVKDKNIARPNIIEGNVVWNCGQGIDITADAIVRNNIVIDSLETQSHSAVPRMRNVTFVNNTVIGSITLRGWAGGNDIPSSLTVANNVTYGGFISGAPVRSTIVSNLQYSSAGGATNVFVNPSARDYWPAPGSPLIGAANPTHAPQLDFNAKARQTPFDIGAYETDGIASNPGWKIVSGFKKLTSSGDTIAPAAPKNVGIR